MLKPYILKLKNPAGTNPLVVLLWASSSEAAKEKIMAAEKCPATSILEVKLNPEFLFP